MKKTILVSALAVAFSMGAVSCKKDKKEETAPVEEVVTEEMVEEAPVAVNAVDAEVLQKVQDAVKDFPSVKVEDVDGVLTLTGEVSGTQALKIKQSVDALKIGKYNNNLVVK